MNILQNVNTYIFNLEIAYMHSLCYILSARKNSHGLFIDYGEEHAFSDSFRGIMNNKIIKGDEILKYAGQCDLTSYVNFASLKNIIHKYSSLKFGGLMKQGDFLVLMGIQSRLNVLQAATTNNKIKDSIFQQAKLLTDPNEMGDNYKCMYIHKANQLKTYPFLDDILDEYRIKF